MRVLHIRFECVLIRVQFQKIQLLFQTVEDFETAITIFQNFGIPFPQNSAAGSSMSSSPFIANTSQRSISIANDHVQGPIKDNFWVHQMPLSSVAVSSTQQQHPDRSFSSANLYENTDRLPLSGAPYIQLAVNQRAHIPRPATSQSSIRMPSALREDFRGASQVYRPQTFSHGRPSSSMIPPGYQAGSPLRSEIIRPNTSFHPGSRTLPGDSQYSLMQSPNDYQIAGESPQLLSSQDSPSSAVPPRRSLPFDHRGSSASTTSIAKRPFSSSGDLSVRPLSSTTELPPLPRPTFVAGETLDTIASKKQKVAPKEPGPGKWGWSKKQGEPASVHSPRPSTANRSTRVPVESRIPKQPALTGHQPVDSDQPSHMNGEDTQRPLQVETQPTASSRLPTDIDASAASRQIMLDMQYADAQASGDRVESSYFPSDLNETASMAPRFLASSLNGSSGAMAAPQTPKPRQSIPPVSSSTTAQPPDSHFDLAGTERTVPNEHEEVEPANEKSKAALDRIFACLGTEVNNENRNQGPYGSVPEADRRAALEDYIVSLIADDDFRILCEDSVWLLAKNGTGHVSVTLCHSIANTTARLMPCFFIEICCYLYGFGHGSQNLTIAYGKKISTLLLRHCQATCILSLGRIAHVFRATEVF